MKHAEQINAEFVKHARDWDDLSIEEQKDYLHRHPKSKRRLTAKPKKIKDMSIDELKKENSKLINEMDKIIRDGGKVMLNDPLSVRMKQITREIKRKRNHLKSSN